MRAVRFALFALALLPSLATNALATHRHDRTGFMIGFGIGGGSAGLEDGGSREGSVTGNFRIGYSVRPDLVLHYEGSAWTKTISDPIGDVTGIVR
jgi:hypothetical protein